MTTLAKKRAKKAAKRRQRIAEYGQSCWAHREMLRRMREHRRIRQEKP